jgi:hypothetical protein
MQSRQPLTTSRKSPDSDRDTGKDGLTLDVQLRGPEAASVSASRSNSPSARARYVPRRRLLLWRMPFEPLHVQEILLPPGSTLVLNQVLSR